MKDSATGNITDTIATDNTSMPESRIFKMGHGNMILTLLTRYGMVWMAVAAVAVAAGIILGLLIDLRWITVALMIVLILIPAACSFLYIGKGFSPNCVINIVPHTIRFTDDSLVIQKFKVSIPDDYTDSGNALEIEDTDNKKKSDKGKDSEDLEQAGTTVISYKELGKYIVGNSSVTLTWGDGFIWIPADAFSDSETLPAAITLINNSRHTID